MPAQAAACASVCCRRAHLTSRLRRVSAASCCHCRAAPATSRRRRRTCRSTEAPGFAAQQRAPCVSDGACGILARQIKAPQGPRPRQTCSVGVSLRCTHDLRPPAGDGGASASSAGSRACLAALLPALPSATTLMAMSGARLLPLPLRSGPRGTPESGGQWRPGRRHHPSPAVKAAQIGFSVTVSG